MVFWLTTRYPICFVTWLGDLNGDTLCVCVCVCVRERERERESVCVFQTSNLRKDIL